MRTGRPSSYFDGDLDSLLSGRQEVHFMLADGCQLPIRSRSMIRSRHELGRLVASVAEHQAWSPAPCSLKQALAFADTRCEMSGGLRFDRGEHATGLASKPMAESV